MPESNPTSAPRISPIRYDSSIEQLDKDEAETSQGLIDTITKIQRKVYEDSSHASRGVHAKGHGVLIGEIRVSGGLPAHLAQGLFASSASFPIIMRFSTIPGDALAAHRPLGAMNRVRKTVYDAAARFRAEHNQVTVVEPKSIDELRV